MHEIPSQSIHHIIQQIFYDAINNANESIIKSINDHLDALGTSRSNVENADPIEDLTAQRNSLYRLLTAVNEELGFELLGM